MAISSSSALCFHPLKVPIGTHLPQGKPLLSYWAITEIMGETTTLRNAFKESAFEGIKMHWVLELLPLVQINHGHVHNQCSQINAPSPMRYAPPGVARPALHKRTSDIPTENWLDNRG